MNEEGYHTKVVCIKQIGQIYLRINLNTQIVSTEHDIHVVNGLQEAFVWQNNARSNIVPNIYGHA